MPEICKRCVIQDISAEILCVCTLSYFSFPGRKRHLRTSYRLYASEALFLPQTCGLLIAWSETTRVPRSSSILQKLADSACMNVSAA